MMNPFAQLILMLVGIYITIILLRFFLQYFRADFFNPMSQFTIKATDPLIKPIRQILPSVAGLDLSTLLLAYLFSLLSIFIKLGSFDPILSFLILGIIQLLQNILSLFVFLVFARIILSWIAPPGHHPVASLVEQLTEPLIAPIRRSLPPMGGFDFSPMILLIIIYFLSNSINYWLLRGFQ